VLLNTNIYNIIYQKKLIHTTTFLKLLYPFSMIEQVATTLLHQTRTTHTLLQDNSRAESLYLPELQRIITLSSMDNKPSSSRKRKISPSSSDGKPPKKSNAGIKKSSRKDGKRRSKVEERLLGEDYDPSDQDVICARGKDASNHVSENNLTTQTL
jgi:hypothetical protein